MLTMNKKEVEIYIDLNIKPTNEIVKKLLLSLLDYVLHSRQQIPFNFEIFSAFVKRLNKNEDVNRNMNWKLVKQHQNAKETHDKIWGLKKVIEEIEVPVQVFILLGASIFSPKESYLINLPQTKELDGSFNQPNNDDKINQILLKLVQNEHLKETHLAATNTFIIFKMKTLSNNSQLTKIKHFKIPPSCHKFVIHFKNNSNFDIFEDSFKELQINKENNAPDNQKKTDDDDIYYQSKVYVKGFNDISINNKSIWNF
ncbi:unnamed protein product [Diamesa serratosioi]